MQSQKNSFSFMWKTTISLYWNLRISELSLFALFFNLLFCCPTTKFWAIVEGAGNNPMLMTVPLFLFLLEGQKRLDEEITSWWSAQRSFNWNHSNSYIILQPTDLFCYTVLIFVKSKMLISFNLLTHKYWGNIKPHMVSQWSKCIVFLLKYKGTFI